MSSVRAVPSKPAVGNLPYSGYYRRGVLPEDAELTHSGAGTPLGEYMRRFWQPVCLSSQLSDLPHKIRILGEDLVAFRDFDGRVGVLHRHCCHRGASLEYGIVQQHGIRCCYHGIQFDVDGSILDVPGEPQAERFKSTLSQGAYPAFERDGLVFAYMGPPELKPAFPEYDAFEKYDDTRLVPFSNVFECNWLQSMDNIADQMHTFALHNTAFVYAGRPAPQGLDFGKTSLSSGFVKLPVMDYAEVRDGTAMVFIAGRRIDEHRVWVRMNDLIVPNITQHAYLFEDGTQRRLWHRVHMSRWYVPVDDTHSIIFGWRMLGKAIDPHQMGDERKLGWDNMDFLEGQVGNRSYEEGQRLPGDWEAIVSQRPIAVHALENPLSGDIGVYMNRRNLRNAVRGKNPAADPARMHQRANAGQPTHCYTNNTVLEIPQRPTPEEDQEMIRQLGRDIVAVATAADAYTGRKRDAYVRAKLEALERRLQLKGPARPRKPAKPLRR